MNIYVLLMVNYINTHVLQIDLLSSEATIAVTFVVTIILTLIITAVITFIVTYICVKQKFKKIIQDLKDKQQNNTVLNEQIIPPSYTVTRADLELQPNPAYSSSHKVTMDTNVTYV